jgi:hypothetical protein
MNVTYRKTKAYTPLLLKQDRVFNTILRDSQRVGLDLATMYVERFERTPTAHAREIIINEMMGLFFSALDHHEVIERCERCDTEVGETHLSDLNFQTICDTCQADEKARPDYEEGRAFVEASGYEKFWLPPFKVVRDV